MMSRISCLSLLSADEEKAIQARFFSVEPMMCVCQYFGLLLKADGHAELIGQPHEQAENWKTFRAEDWTGVVKLYKSDSHIVGLKQDGTVVACGRNDKNQCETGDWRDIREVYVSEEATSGIAQNGTNFTTYTFQPAPAAQPAQMAQPAPTAQSQKKEPDFYYAEHDDGTLTITKYRGHEQNITIPYTINNKKVMYIGAKAFAGCADITSVTIPETVTKIGVRAFEGCSSLTSITLPNSVTSIGEWSFSHCISLTYVVISDNLKSIGERAFCGCSHLTSVTIFDHIKRNKGFASILFGWLGFSSAADKEASIGKWAFAGCDELTSVDIPNSVTSIGEFVFFQCTGLSSVTIPESVTIIGDMAFYNCQHLKTVNIPDSVESIGYFTFSDCPYLTIYGSPSSYAEKFAKENGVRFKTKQ